MALLDGIRSAGAGLSRLTERWVPDSWVICMILTTVALLLAVLGAGVGLQEAVLGATVQVPTVHGKVSMKIPPGSNSGSRLRLKGKGVVDAKSGEAGDQYVTMRVVLPEQPDEELKSFIERWAAQHRYDPRDKAGLG